MIKDSQRNKLFIKEYNKITKFLFYIVKIRSGKTDEPVKNEPDRAGPSTFFFFF